MPETTPHSRTAPPTAGHPARALIIATRSAALADMVAREHRGPVTRVEDVLSALGELPRSADEPTVVLHATADEPALSASAAALRRLRPRARLVLIGPGALTAGVVGFDTVLGEPLDLPRLREALTAEASQAPQTFPPIPAHPIAAHPGIEPQPDAELGDTDLIDCLLERRSDFQRIALEMLTQQSGIPGLRYEPHGPGTPVTHRRQQYGVLTAPEGTDPQALQGWAQWLGHWMAMAGRIDSLWRLAHQDELTGVWNRRYFNAFLDRLLRRAAQQRFQVTVMVMDIDNFKLFNDRHGHDAGDDILREAANLLRSSVRTHDVVARIGGDEFAVIFWDPDGPRRPNSQHPIDVHRAAERFRRAICEHRFPKLGDDAPGTLTISAGLAGYPWDGTTREQLVHLADAMALKSKRQGKNAILLGPGAMDICESP